jgi:ABC-2 type transport system permease protein
VLWFVSTVVDLVWGSFFLRSKGVANHLDDPKVIWTIGASLVAYGLWALFGLGLGALLRSQLWASVVGAVVYTVGFALSWVLFDLISQQIFHSDRYDGWAVIAPAVAAEVAVSRTPPLPHSPPEWVGLAVMLGYGIVMTVIGVWIINRRDIS